MSKVKEYYLEEEYNPIEAIDKLQQENAKLRIQISAREEEYIKLQEENEYFNHCDEEKRKKITNLEYKIERLEEDNKQLKELCNKYEEEHSTTFQIWKYNKDTYKEENERLNNIIDELIEEYINYMKKQDFAKKCNISRPYLDKLLKKMNRKEIYEFCKIRNKLKGDNK